MIVEKLSWDPWYAFRYSRWYYLRYDRKYSVVVSAALGGLLDWCVSEPILAEYEEVLRCDQFPLSGS